VTTELRLSQSQGPRVLVGVTRGHDPQRADLPVAAAPEQLVAGLRARDARAFRALYDVYRARLYSFLLRLTGDEPLARDLSQETWLRLSVNATRLRPDTDLGAWLFTVARNLYISHRRWSFLSRTRLRQLAQWTAGSTASENSASETLGARQTGRVLEQALASLPVNQREVVLLVCVEGFSTLAVSRILEVEHATVRQRLARARAELKKAILPREVP
jgi:RNA polymerase sigma factor (sigma-70 family)